MDAYVSKEQFCKMCHISKATALRLIEAGLIPVIDTQKKTKRYQIAYRDVENYLAKRVIDPWKYSGVQNGKVQTYDYLQKYNSKTAKNLRDIAEIELASMPELLQFSDVSKFLGYQNRTIRRWWKELGLHVLVTSTNVYIPQQSLLDFIEQPVFYNMKKKSRKHIELLRRASYEGV